MGNGVGPGVGASLGPKVCVKDGFSVSVIVGLELSVGLPEGAWVWGAPVGVTEVGLAVGLAVGLIVVGLLLGA